MIFMIFLDNQTTPVSNLTETHQEDKTAKDSFSQTRTSWARSHDPGYTAMLPIHQW